MEPHSTRRSLLAAATLAVTLPAFAGAATESEAAVPVEVHYKTVTVDGIEIFYREAGAADRPVVLLLHGFPSSSHMFRNLIPRLADKYRVLAPDYPGFGDSAQPALGAFPYPFEALARIVERFTHAVGASRYTIYMQDYGGPVGLRLALADPARVRGFIVQNAVVTADSWNPDVVKDAGPFWRNRTPETEAPMRGLLKPETTKFQYTHGAARVDRLSPDGWRHDQAGLDRPGNDLVQLQLLHDYQTNIALYPAWQNYLATRKPPMLIVWGKNDPFFLPVAVDRFTALVPGAQAHLSDAGHFALETHAPEIAARIRTFLAALDKAA